MALTPLRRALLLMGPTASGKTALALALADEMDAVIINADSMQMYRDLRILTARPTPEEEAQAPHRLFGCIDGAERFSVGAWLAMAVPALREAQEGGRTPIIVGGTGLYFRALTKGLAEMPTPSPDIRAHWQAQLEARGAAALHADLAERDPLAAQRLQPGDAARVLRALEVLDAAGVSIVELQGRTGPAPLAAGEWVGVALVPQRTALYARIDARFEAMLAAGALDEARLLVNRGLAPDLPLMKAHGVPALAAYFRGALSLQEAAHIGKQDTRRYAKRQFTWIANQMPDFQRIEEADLAARLTLIRAAQQSCA